MGHLHIFLFLCRKSTFIRLLTTFYMEKKKSKSFREYSLAACECVVIRCIAGTE